MRSKWRIHTLSHTHSVHLKRVGSPSTILCGQAFQTECSLSDTCFICCININGLNHFLLSFHFIKRSISKLKYAVYKRIYFHMHSNEALRRCCREASALSSRANRYACKFSRVKLQHFFALFPDSGKRSLAQAEVRGHLHSITSNVLIFL